MEQHGVATWVYCIYPTSSQRPGKGDSDWKQIKFLVPFNRKLEKRSKGLLAL